MQLLADSQQAQSSTVAHCPAIGRDVEKSISGKVAALHARPKKDPRENRAGQKPYQRLLMIPSWCDVAMTVHIPLHVNQMDLGDFSRP